MEFLNIIRLGDKVEMRVAQQVEAKDKNAEMPKVHKSQVVDILDNGNILLSIPTEGGHLVLLSLGIRFEIVFYSSGGLYRAVGVIKERYKKENIYILEIELKSQIEKFQRREFFRYPCSLDLKFFVLSEEEAKMDTVDDIFVSLRDENFNEKIEVGNLVDLSGGGTRFRTEREVLKTDTLLLELRLKNLIQDEQYYIVANVVDSNKVDINGEDFYEVRTKFRMDDDKIREEIVRYIFEEERRRLKKEKR